MQGPRSPEAHEFSDVVEFLNQNLRLSNPWPISGRSSPARR